MTVLFDFLDGPPPLAFAHRGGAADGIENTLTAFGRAIDLGYRYLETDVHATADGKVVAFHDSVLDRVTDSTGMIRALPWSQVQRARIGENEQVPLLEDVLGNWPEARVNIDVKADSAVEPLIEVIRRTNSLHRVCIGSFSDTRLARARAALGPALCTSMGPRTILRLRTASWFRFPSRFSGACIQVPIRARGITIVDQRFVDYAHQLGLPVHVWTVDDPVEMAKLLDLGVDGIMTDQIEVLRRVYRERGVWSG